MNLTHLKPRTRFVFVPPVRIYRNCFSRRCPRCQRSGIVCFDNESQREQAFRKITAPGWACQACEKDVDDADRSYHLAHAGGVA